jgi:sulfite reductase (NADPH) flavoprotein alpha-component
MNNILQSDNLTPAQDQLVKELINSLNNEQKLWLGGYLTGMHESTKSLLEIFYKSATPVIQASSVQKSFGLLKILYGTRSGNALKIAKKSFETLQASGITSQLVNLNEYEAKSIKKETLVLIIVSTDGEGEPPVAAEEFYNLIMGSKAPRLENLKYSVMALGDSSYKHFCKIGKDIDNRLAELGARRISNRIDGDVDFEPLADKWIDECISELSKANPDIKLPGLQKDISVHSVYTRSNPFPARILDRILLNGKGSTKETYHIELSIEGSGINYYPGDALGIKCRNDLELVESIIYEAKLDASSVVLVDKHEKTLKEALINDFEISSLTGQVVENYAKLLNNKQLNSLVEDNDKLFSFTYTRDILDLITEFPVEVSADGLLGVLRRLQPRLYSIASGSAAYPDEVHLTVGNLSYYFNNRYHKGVCSNFLSHLPETEQVYVFVDENISFRLPADNNLPVIMIGAGTGIAPYRAFIQQREENGAAGKNWLLFGERNFTTDFLYQSEWQKHLKNKMLTRMDVAFSRDQAQKKYIQHKLLDNKKELFRWIEDGAHIYLCGDKKSMAVDVRNTLQNIIQTEGGLSAEKAGDYLKQMRREVRFHEDVY